MIPFVVEFVRGKPAYQQVADAAKRAILRGQIKAGDSFPALHALVQGLRIHPSSARSALGDLEKEGWIDQPEAGRFVVAPLKPELVARRSELLRRDVEAVVREARRLGVSREEVQRLLDENWKAG